MSARRIALVTGASRGIGAATALALAERGCDCVLTARTLAPGEIHERDGGSGATPLSGSLEETAAGVRERGREALPLRVDLLDLASLDAAVDETEKRWGPIEVLVNNGIAQTAGAMDRILDLADENLARVYLGNVIAPLRLIRRVLPGMLARRRGAIVNLVSQSGFSDPPAPSGEGGWGFAYASSKAALARLAGVLAAEHPEDGVRFFNLEPGFVVTEMVKATGLLEQFGSRWQGAPPRMPAEVIAWLVSEDAALAWQGKTVSARELAAELGFWSAPRDAD